METLVHGMLGNAAAVTVLAAVVAIAGRVCRRPALIHSICLLAMLKLITPPVVSVPMPVAAPREIAAPPAPARPESEDDAAAGWPRLAEDPAVDAGWPMEETAPRHVSEPVAIPAPWSWAAVAMALVFAGALAWWTLAAVRIARFHRLLRDVEPMPEEWQAEAAALAARMGLGRPPSSCLVPGDVPPMLWAFGPRVRLLVPSRLWAALGQEERMSLLLHELAHLKRRDHWVRWLELAVAGLYWWHPAVWWLRRALREAEEQCCDAWVVWAMPQGGAKTYAAALVAALEFLSDARHRPAAAASATVGNGHVSSLKRRLHMIVKARTPRGLSWAGRLAVAGLSALLLPLAPTWMPRDAAAAPYDGPDDPSAHATGPGRDLTAYRLRLGPLSARIARVGPGAAQDPDDEDDDRPTPRKDASGRDAAKKADKDLDDLKEKLGDDLNPLAEAVRKTLAKALGDVQQALKKEGMTSEDLRKALEKSRDDLHDALRSGGPLEAELHAAAERAAGDLRELMERSLDEAARGRDDVRSRMDEAREQQRKRMEELAQRRREVLERQRKEIEGLRERRRQAERQRQEERERTRVRRPEEKAAPGDRETIERGGPGREELEAARREIRELRTQLREANSRLETLQRDDRRRPGPPTRPAAPKFQTRPARPEAPAGARDRGADDRRFRDLENKLNQLLKELEDIKGRD